MTVSTTPTPLSYSGNGSTVDFPITWKYNAKSHIVATLRSSSGTETTWALTTNYTLTDPGDTGTLTAVVAPASGETLVISLEPPNTQSSDIPLGGEFPSVTVEDGLDLAAQRDQKIQSLFDRSLRVPRTDIKTGSALELPIDTTRAGKYLAFDADGDPIASAAAAGTAVVSTFMETVLDDTTAAVARTTLGLGTAAVVDTGTSGTKVPLLDGNNVHSGTLTMSGKSLWMAEGAAVASAADCNIWTTDGGTVHVTGTTPPSDWGTAPQAGASKWCTNDSALTLTYNATTNILPGDADIALPANSWFEVYAKSASTYEVRQILFSDGRSLGLVSGTTIATTSGTSHSISIPPWAKKITLMWNAGSTNGTSIPISRIGDSGGAETTGYVSAAHARDGAGSARATATDGFLLNYDSAAANVLYATLVLTLVDAATFLWHAHGAYYETATSSGRIGVLSGSKALSAALTTIHLTTQNGTDTTDAGSLNCMWE